MAKIALIGATGGIGRHVCSRALADGHAVVALARTPSKLDPHPELTVVQGCVTDAQAVSRTWPIATSYSHVLAPLRRCAGRHYWNTTHCHRHEDQRGPRGDDFVCGVGNSHETNA